MRDINRLDNLYEKIKEYHKYNIPDFRFIQLMINFLIWHHNKYNTDGFYIEDDECIKRFNEFIFDLKGGNEEC